MKRFGSLILAAILGSGLTLVSTQWLDTRNNTVKIEHVNGIPTSQVAYRVNENGEAVPLDFTTIAEKVTQAVVHVKATSGEQTVSRERERTQDQADPFQFFFGPNG